MSAHFSIDFPRAFGELTGSADFRSEPEDFQVDEFLGFEPSGQGEHVCLHVWKRGENTAWVAEKIAELAQVGVVDVGYCGRKDRHAVTTQWFSIYLPKLDTEPQWQLLNCDSIKILGVARHQQKLRRGGHETNHFIIRLRDVKTPDRDLFEQKVQQVLTSGVPNYFGEQRFGRNANNLDEAHEVLVNGKRMRDKQKRGLYLSAARSFLFNQVVAARIVAGNWQEMITGEPESFPSGPLWGRGRSLATAELGGFEQNVLSDWAAWCDGLEYAGLAQERRALILKPDNAGWKWDGPDLILSFALGSGEFATTILSELLVLQSAVKTEA